jgi:enoyl-CoA hydratase/carnithine racemase
MVGADLSNNDSISRARAAAPPNAQTPLHGEDAAAHQPGLGASSAAPASTDRIVVLKVPAALGLTEIADFREQLAAALDSTAVRVVVLRGGIDAFCRGMALSDISMDRDRADRIELATKAFADVLLRLREARPITVAVVEGPAVGGGVGISAACDFVIAADAASFALPELRLGLVPAVILPVLAERVGLARARRWALTQATWTAPEAAANALVDHCVPGDRIDAELRRLQRSLLRAHPRGVVALKALARHIGGLETSDAIQCGRATLNTLLESDVTRRELIAFRDFGILPGDDAS